VLAGVGLVVPWPGRCVAPPTVTPVIKYEFCWQRSVILKFYQDWVYLSRESDPIL
jgi:hypothetical protein